MKVILSSAVEAIGRARLVELRPLTPDIDGRLLAKLEFLSPGLSKKDQVARQIIKATLHRLLLVSHATDYGLCPS